MPQALRPVPTIEWLTVELIDEGYIWRSNNPVRQSEIKSRTVYKRKEDAVKGALRHAAEYYPRLLLRAMEK